MASIRLLPAHFADEKAAANEFVRNTCDPNAQRVSSKYKVSLEDRWFQLKNFGSNVLDFGKGMFFTTAYGFAESNLKFLERIPGFKLAPLHDDYAFYSDRNNTALQAGIMAGDIALTGLGIYETYTGLTSFVSGAFKFAAGTVGGAVMAPVTGPAGPVAGAALAAVGTAEMAAGGLMIQGGIFSFAKGASSIGPDWRAVRSAGNAGENYVAQKTNLTKNTNRQTIPGKNGKYRILDFVDSDNNRYLEVKNTKSQGLTQQIIDEMSYAKSEGGVLELWVRPDTALSKPLLEASAKGDIIIINTLFE